MSTHYFSIMPDEEGVSLAIKVSLKVGAVSSGKMLSFGFPRLHGVVERACDKRCVASRNCKLVMNESRLSGLDLSFMTISCVTQGVSRSVL